MIARDWLKSLWRTSYKGASFWVETDNESGARRIVIHEFPMRDTPYLEDLGERYREFTVTAYVASDKADSEASTLMTICSTRGPGILVLPTQGPVFVRCLAFNRVHAKDKLGYIAHELKFVREGFGSALASVTNLINMIFVQAENTSLVAAQEFAKSSLIKNVPDYVSGALQAGTETALATFEVVRTTVNVEPTVSARQRDAIEAAFVALPIVLTNEDAASLQAVATVVMTAATELVENMDPAVALPTMADIVQSTPVETLPSETNESHWRMAVAVNQHAAYTLLRIAALTAYCEAVALVALADRPAAITLRANVSTYFEEQLNALPSQDFEIYNTLVKLRDATIDYLSRAILDLAPVVKVHASLGMPSLFWAWRLYADPTRSSELVARNRIAHPSFMPPSFEALGK